MQLLIHSIDDFGSSGVSSGVAIHFNNVKKKIFGSGYKVVGSASGKLCLDLNYNEEGDLVIKHIISEGSQKAYGIMDESFQMHLVDAFAIGRILSAAKNSQYANAQMKDKLNRLSRSKELVDAALGGWS